MPKELTHWLVAERALAGLAHGSNLRKTIETHRSAYLGGAILPDTLLHLFQGPHAPTALDVAHSFHNTDGNSFYPLIHADQLHPEGIPPALLACLLGVITHIETDIIFHPFVEALTGSAGIGRHYLIETEIDCYFLHHGALSQKKQLVDLISSDTKEIFITTCDLLFNTNGVLPRPALEQALALHCRIQAMYDKTFWKLAVQFLAIVWGIPFSEQRHLFYPLQRLSANCYTNIDARKWKHPVTGVMQYSAVEDLVNNTIQRTTALFERIEEAGSLAAALRTSPGENMLTGMHGVRWRL